MTVTAITAIPPQAAFPPAGDGAGSCPRAGYAAGLRALASRLEECPEQVPLPFEGRAEPITIHFLYHDGGPCEAMAAAARALGGPWREQHRDYGPGGGAYYDLLGEPGGLRVRLTAYRDAACEQDGDGWRARPALAGVLAAGAEAA